MCDYFAGWISGVASLLIGHPLDTIKTQQQILGLSFSAAVKRIVKHRGLKGFYRGLLTPLLATGTINALFFGVYGDVRNYLMETRETRKWKWEKFIDSFSDENGKVRNEKIYLRRRIKLLEEEKDSNGGKLTELFISGAVAGACCLSLSTPTELIKTKLQSQMRRKLFTGPFHCFYIILKEAGIRGLFRGIAPQACSETIGGGVYFVTYEIIKNQLVTAGYDNLTSKSPLVYAIGGACSVNLIVICCVLKLCNKTVDQYKPEEIVAAYGFGGIAAWIFCLPFDTIKSRMQADDHKKPHYVTMRCCAKEILKTDGVVGLYRGLLSCMARAIPVNAAIYTVYETLHINFCSSPKKDTETDIRGK